MKRNLLCASIVAIAFGAIAGTASAQTCANNDTWQPPVGGGDHTGDTCTGEATGSNSGFCGGLFDAPGPAYVIRSTFAGSRTASTVSFASTGGNYTLAAYAVAAGSGCNANGQCASTGSASTPMNVTSAFMPDGDYFLIVTGSSNSGAGGCGTFTATANGTFPVALQNFSVD